MTERTLILVKPDGVQRGLIGEVIKRFEQRGLKIVGLKMARPTFDHVSNFYPKDDEWLTRLGNKGFTTFEELGMDAKEIMGTTDPKEAGIEVRKWLMDYMTGSPIVAMVIEGFHSVATCRKVVGHTLPFKAEVGTIRGDFSSDSSAAANPAKRAIKNVVHASETIPEAKTEIAHWFSESEIYEWDRPDHSAMY